MWEKIDKIMQPSTLKGLVMSFAAVVSAIIKIVTGEVAFDVNQLSLYIIDFAIAFYGVVQIFRDEDARTAKVVKDTLKVMAILILPLLLLGGQAQAADLFCSVEGTVTHFDVEITDSAGTVIEEKIEITDFVKLEPDTVNGGFRYKIMNVDHLPPVVSYTFIVTACNNSWCEVSDPYTTGRPQIGRVIVI